MNGNLSYENFYRLQFRYGITHRSCEAIKAEWARVEAAEETNIRTENLIAEEIDLGKEFELL